METLHLLGTALGLGALAGINLYLTVFVTGLAIQQGWITLAPQYGQLAILSDPAIVAIAGVLYFLEFFADKVPWVDSLWDSVHTIVRPIGGAMLGLRAIGSTNPAFDVVIALLAGGVALTTHSLKAGTRLVANTSPEPFSNIGLSLAEDAAVLGGLALIYSNPTIALGVIVAGLVAAAYFGPKLFRSISTKIWLVWRKLNVPAIPSDSPVEIPKTLPADADILLHTLESAGNSIDWAVPCITGGSKKIGANRAGYLVALEGDPIRVLFISKGRFRKAAEALELTGYKVSHESKFLSENLVLYPLDRRPKRIFLFDRSQRRRVARLAEVLRERLGSA